MRVTLTNGKLIDVKFRKEEIRPGVVRSFCRISKVKDAAGKGRDNYVPIIEAFATRNPHDAPSKGAGFKAALVNALNALEMGTLADRFVSLRSNGLFLPKLQSKEDRKLVWDAFLAIYKKNLD